MDYMVAYPNSEHPGPCVSSPAICNPCSLLTTRGACAMARACSQDHGHGALTMLPAALAAGAAFMHDH